MKCPLTFSLPESQPQAWGNMQGFLVMAGKTEAKHCFYFTTPRREVKPNLDFMARRILENER